MPCNIYPDVALWHNNALVSNTSIVDLEGITGGSDLLCLTNTVACCRNAETGSGGVGAWFFPDGAIVPGSGRGFSRDRGTSLVALTYASGSTPPSGLYRCVIPDSNGQNVTLLAGIYRRGQGKTVTLRKVSFVRFYCDRHSYDQFTNCLRLHVERSNLHFFRRTSHHSHLDER